MEFGCGGVPDLVQGGASGHRVRRDDEERAWQLRFVVVTAAQSSVFPKHADDDAADVKALGTERLHAWVGRLEADATISLPEELL